MNYLLSVINLILIQCLLYFSLIDKTNRKKIISFLSISILTSILSCIFVNHTLILPLFGLKWNILMPMIFAIEILLLIPIANNKIHMSITILIPFMIDLLIKALGSLVFHLPFSEINRTGYFYFSFSLFSIQVFLEIFLFILYSVLKNIEKYHENKFEVIIIISLITIELIAYFIINYNLSTIILTNQSAYIQVILLNIFLVILFIISIIAFCILQKSIKKKYQLINQYKEELLDKSYQDIYIESQEELLKLRHDMANMIESINTFNSSQLLEMKKDLSSKLNEQKFLYTKEKLINSILVNKIKFAKEKGIQTEIEITIERPLQMNNIDIISLLSNLLDNSIEALEQENNKELSLIMGTTENTLEILLKNTCSSFSNKTKKENHHYHGFGIKIIKDIVKKYNGNYTTEIENGVFTTMIEIKC